MDIDTGEVTLSESIDEFQIQVDDSILQDLHHRLEQTRFPDQIEDAGWDYGIPVDYLRELVDYWRDSYDWRAEEARLNGFDHYRTPIDGQRIHFIHAIGPSGCPPAPHHPRLARIHRGVPRRHPAADRPGVLRRRPRRCLPRHRSVAPWLRVLRTATLREVGTRRASPGRSPS